MYSQKAKPKKIGTLNCLAKNKLYIFGPTTFVQLKQKETNRKWPKKW